MTIQEGSSLFPSVDKNMTKKLMEYEPQAARSCRDHVAALVI
jgi:hypothetical protein